MGVFFLALFEQEKTLGFPHMPSGGSCNEKKSARFTCYTCGGFLISKNGISRITARMIMNSANM